MKVLGLRCGKEKLDWALVQGTSRADAQLLEAQAVSAPSGERGQQLAWVRSEVQELIQSLQPDHVRLRVAEPGGRGNSLPRAETEGVVQEALASSGITCRRMPAVSLRAAFKARNGADLEAACLRVPVIAGTAKSRRDPVVAAVAGLPE